MDAAGRIRAAAVPHGGQVNVMPAARFRCVPGSSIGQIIHLLKYDWRKYISDVHFSSGGNRVAYGWVAGRRQAGCYLPLLLLYSTCTICCTGFVIGAGVLYENY